MNQIQVISHAPEQTEGLAQKLAASFVDGDLLVLEGPLGAGKTTFVRGLAVGRGLGEEAVNSPTYTFVNEYHGRQPLFHFDLYRLGDPSELIEIGWEEYRARPGVIVVEWGDKAEYMLPERYYKIEFNILSDNEREIIVSLVQP